MSRRAKIDVTGKRRKCARMVNKSKFTIFSWSDQAGKKHLLNDFFLWKQETFSFIYKGN